MSEVKNKKKKSSIIQVSIGVLAVIMAILIIIMMGIVSDIQGTARIVNYTGLVRGETQRLIKLELSMQQENEMIHDIRTFIDGLRNGNDELNLVRLNDVDFQNKMQELDDKFSDLYKKIYLVRFKGARNTDIIPESEEFFVICDEATGLAEKYSQKKATSLSLLEKYITADIVVLMLAPKIKNVTIDDLDWKRTIDIEEVVTHNESDWSLPDDARLQYTKSEIQSYKDVLDHYETVTETKTRSVIDHYEEKSSYVDLGNGYFEEQTESVPVYTEETYTEDVEKPVYRKEPVYATKYYYEIDKWTVVDTAKSSGNDQNPSWPEPKLKDGQRTGAEEEHYFVTATYEKKKGKTETGRYEMDFSQWKELKKGEKIELKIDAAGFAEINQK